MGYDKGKLSERMGHKTIGAKPPRFMAVCLPVAENKTQGYCIFRSYCV